MPQRLSNGVLAEPIPELRAKYAGLSDTASAAANHRRYLHAQSALEESSAELTEVYTLAELDHQTRQRIQEFASVALTVLEDIITGKLPASLALRAKYAHLHLGRAGYGVINKTSTMSQHLTREDIEAIKDRATSAQADIQE
jgi:hypothetical protein